MLQLPWCDAPPSPETYHIYESLKFVIGAGFLTINSQPRVNGVPSNHQKFGWGGPDGVVFQKAYLEFFVAPDLFERLLKAFRSFPSLTYHAMNAAGTEYRNVPMDRANAVTWGVFPGREILQPTVVDPASFRVWKDEAFELWLAQWGSVYDVSVPAEAQARKVIQSIHDNYYLVNVVDNEYVAEDADIFTIFR